ERFGDRKTEGLGGRKIDDKLESGWLLDWNIAGLCTPQNLVDQLGRAPEQIREVWAVGHETARLNKRADIENHRQTRAERKRDDSSTVGVNECIAHNVKCVRLCLERLERGCNILGSPDFERHHLDAETASHGLNLGHLQHALGKVSISDDCQPTEPGENLRKSSRRLLAISVDWVDSPVTLPPGRARLATTPAPTGSSPNAKTMGMTAVACINVGTASAFETMTSTLRRTNSAAISAWRSGRPSDQRYSIAMVRPSIHPSSCSRCTKAEVQGRQ